MEALTTHRRVTVPIPGRDIAMNVSQNPDTIEIQWFPVLFVKRTRRGDPTIT